MFVGSRQLTLHDAELGLQMPLLLLYPTRQAPHPVAFGPYVMDVSPEAEIATGQFPLVLISHGSGGSHLLYRSIALHLAAHGYMVAMLEHPGNNRLDNQFMGKAENLQYRPRHLQLAADTLFADAQLAGHLQPQRFAVIGHSMGGYSALALAGGEPWYPPEAFKPDADPELAASAHKVAVVHDARLQALVLLAPATVWFLPAGALAKVDLPILMLSAEHDPYTPAWHNQIVLQGVANPARVQARVVANAGHFSFLSPFPPKIKSGGSLPTQDPEGFNREAFHEQLKQEILVYLNLHYLHVQ